MRLVAITNTNSSTGYCMPVILYSDGTKPAVRTQTNYKKIECDQFLVLGHQKGEHTYNVIAEISSDPSNSLCDSSDESSLKANAYQLTRQAA